jgi:hypothetical protein
MANEFQLESHYVVHVRVEKVTKIADSVRPNMVIPKGIDAKREVEEVVSVVRKSKNIESAIEFAKNALDLVNE